jgi:hypothetical protein
MTDQVRLLNTKGVDGFRQFLADVRAGLAVKTPKHLLADSATSEAAAFSAKVKVQHFTSAYVMGEYLCQSVLANANKAEIAHDAGLWNWLSLYFFEQLCPTVGGERHLLENSAYLLEREYDYRRYYRHIVRSAWILVAVHGATAKVLLTPGSAESVAPVAVRTEVPMQLVATQQYVESRGVVEVASMLYYDEQKGQMKKGFSSKGAGSPRRLVAVLNQLDLTYDLHECPAAQLLALLPKEFARFKPKSDPGKKSIDGGTA